MNALVSARANTVGTLSVRRQERVEARKDIFSNFRARLEGIQRALQQQELLKAGASALTAAPPQAEGEKAAASTKGNFSGVNGPAATRKPANDEMGKDAYLQLLVQQLSHQDPTEPMDNQAMIAQLAQFSSLEQMQNLNTSFQDYSQNFDLMNGNIDQLNFISAQGLLGKFVEGVGVNGEVLSGTVDSVHLDGSVVVLTVDGKPMPMSGVVGIATEQPATPPAAGKEGLFNGLFRRGD